MMVGKLSLPVVLIIAIVLGSQVRELAAQKNIPLGNFSSYHSDKHHPSDGQWVTTNQFEVYYPAAAAGLKPVGDQRRPSNPAPGSPRRGGHLAEEQRRRSWSEQISTDRLLLFLKEHEAELAQRLEKLREDNPRNFSDQVRALKELYGPVIQQMERDPEAAKFSLEKIRLRLKIQDAVAEVKRSRRGAYDEAKKKLAGHVEKLFEVIVKEQGHEVEQMEQWLKNRDDRRNLTRSEYRSRWDYIEQSKQNIANWEKNKDDIVKQRVEKLLQQHPDFPWGS